MTIILKDRSGYHKGIVLKSHGSFYHVDIGDQVISCGLRGKFRQEKSKCTQPIVVGDKVYISLNQHQEGMVEEILPRETQLSRPSPRNKRKEHVVVANVSQAIIVVTHQYPSVPFGFIDRVLIGCGDYEIQPVICINKKDILEDPNIFQEYKDIYENLPLSLVFVSAKTGENIDQLKDFLKDEISVFVGQSGVGKSSLLNAVEEKYKLKVGEISNYTNKGKHTTTYSSLLKLSIGGYVVDTPGLKEFGLRRKLPKRELCYYFPEMESYLSECKFQNCLHTKEPHCAIKKAVEEKEIHLQRYQSYCKILESMES